MGERHAPSWSRVRAVARETFGIDKFRPGQGALIRAVLSGEDAFGILPTGAGKSLTFQLPALFLDGLVVVVSPLIALMQDQHEKLGALEVPAHKLDSTLTVTEEREALREIGRGHSEIVYVTPERLEKAEQLAVLKRRGVSLFVVDEAHCVSQWGHDFRPAYLGLKDAIRELGRPPVLALTATATPEVISDVTAQLGISGARRVDTGIERENLSFEVIRTPRAGEKRAALRRLLEETEGVGIVYVATIRAANELHRWLESEGISAGLYHGRLAANRREEVQRQFMENAFRVMVATNAFGMGIDKPDLRLVVHYQFPDSLERYYQEAGRAGRDGAPARAVLLYRLEDKRVQSFFLEGKYPGKAQALRAAVALEASADAAAGPTFEQLATLADLPLQRVKVIASLLEAAGIARRRRGRVQRLRELQTADAERLLTAYEERLAQDKERLDTMMRYAQSTRCRMQSLRDYFGEEEGSACGRCDRCRQPARKRPRQIAKAMAKDSLETLAASVTGVRSAAVGGLAG